MPAFRLGLLTKFLLLPIGGLSALFLGLLWYTTEILGREYHAAAEIAAAMLNNQRSSERTLLAETIADACRRKLPLDQDADGALLGANLADLRSQFAPIGYVGVFDTNGRVIAESGTSNNRNNPVVVRATERLIWDEEDRVVIVSPLQSKTAKNILLELRISQKREMTTPAEALLQGIAVTIRQDILSKTALFACLVIVFSLLLALALKRALLAPLQRLRDASISFSPLFAKSQDIPVLKLPADKTMAELTTAFNEMTAGLNRYRRELALHQEELERTVALRTTELKHANDDLRATLLHLRETQTQLIHSAKMAALGQLVGGIAHEINNPLMAITGNLSFIEDLINSALKTLSAETQNETLHVREELVSIIDAVQDAGLRTNIILQQLQLFSGVGSAAHKEIDLAQSLPLAGAFLATTDQTHITWEIGDEHLYVCGNPGELHQAFMHILLNAREAVGKHGKIHISTSLDASTITICVRDNGVGIPIELREKVFEPFFTTKADRKAYGLGLSIAHAIIVNHGGSIAITCPEAGGTSVSIILPRSYGEKHGDYSDSTASLIAVRDE